MNRKKMSVGAGIINTTAVMIILLVLVLVVVGVGYVILSGKLSGLIEQITYIFLYYFCALI